MRVSPGDHLVLAQAGAHAPQEPVLDALTSAAALFAATRTLRVGHLVLNNLFRHPMITAQASFSESDRSTMV